MSAEHSARFDARAKLKNPIEPGQALRRVRERLSLRYREVEAASECIAARHGNNEFLIGLSRLADIENRGTIPSIYRLYSLCAIYRLDLAKVLGWYGIDLDQLPVDAARLSLENTHPVDLTPSAHTSVPGPTEVSSALDLKRTFYISRQVRRWGALPLSLINALNLEHNRYAFIGTDDWSMYPLLTPGSFVQVDESRRKVAADGWTHELERPIYLVDCRTSYRCGWCTEGDGQLIVLPHSASHLPPGIFRYPDQAEVIGQVVAVAMRLDQGKRRHTRS